MEIPRTSLPEPLLAVLARGEAVLWTGRPAAFPYVAGGLLVTVPLGIIAVGSALSWTHGSDLAQLPPWAKAVLGLVLVFAAHMLILRPLLGLYHARHTYYAVTDRRAVVVCDAWGGRLQQLAHDQGAPVAVKGPGSFGKIQFSRSAGSSVDVLIFGRAAMPGFYGLTDVDRPLAVLLGQRGGDAGETHPA
jgi:hypothetical protein